MSLDGFDTLARMLAEAVLNGLWQGVALTCLVWLALRFAPRTGPSTRFCIWSAALAAVLAMPFLHLSGAFPEYPAAPLPAPVHLSAGAPVLLLGAWALIAAVLLGRLIWSYGYVAWLARTSAPLDQARHPRARLRIRTSRETEVPIVVGFLQPAILIPSALLDQLNPAELHQIVLHESAHIRRLDHWTNALLELVQALFFFHPAIWCIANKLRLERELACDDAVVTATSDPVSYAGCLARLAELHSFTLSPGAAGDARHLFRRVNRLLDWRSAAGFSAARFAAASALLLAAALYARQLPQWIDIPAPMLALQSPRPAIESSRRTLLAEERIRAANILMDTAQQRLASADRILRQARQQMRLAVQTAQGITPPPVPVSRVNGSQPVPAHVPKLSKI
jgi:BlaR1 peptidase M56